MVMHFAREAITSLSTISSRLSQVTLDQANTLPSYQRSRYLASRSLLAELLFMLYDIKQLPHIELSENGRPHFSDPTLPDFSIACAGNIVGVLLTSEGRCGLEMNLQHHFSTPQSGAYNIAAGNETIWVNNQPDPSEARLQLHTLRQSIMKLTDAMTTSLQLLPISGRLKVENEPHIEAISDVEDILVWSCTATIEMAGLHLWKFDSHHHWSELTNIKNRCNSLNSRTIRLVTTTQDIKIPNHGMSQRG